MYLLLGTLARLNPPLTLPNPYTHLAIHSFPPARGAVFPTDPRQAKLNAAAPSVLCGIYLFLDIFLACIFKLKLEA
jgi:hypothetical protein